MNLKAYIQKYIDVKLILLLAAFYTLFYIVFIIKTAYLRAYVYAVENIKYSLSYLILHSYLIDWVIVVLFMSVIAISTKRLILKNVAWKNIIVLHISLSLFMGVIIRVLSTIYDVASGIMSLSQLNIRESITNSVLVMDLNFLIYFAMVFIIYVYYYIEQIKQSEDKRLQLETQLVNTRMQMLAAQLQPHFLFNTLNSVSSLIEIDAKCAQNTIADLSDFLREILYNTAKFIPLDKELTVLEYYLNILKVRFSDHLHITKNVDPALSNFKVPSMILQPIVENSIKHGYSYNHTDLKIIISAQLEKDMLFLKIENNGKLLRQLPPEVFNNGVGLSNLKERLFNLYGENHTFYIKNKTDASGVETVLILPKINLAEAIGS